MGDSGPGRKGIQSLLRIRAAHKPDGGPEFSNASLGIHTRSRRAISEHRHRRKLRDREVSDRSRRGLDWTNFFLADVQMSFGSFLAFYLADLGWSKQNVGLALTVGGLAAVAAQIPGGALADAVRWKRGLAACGFVLIAAAALILAQITAARYTRLRVRGWV
jgi:Major Facilitator Superfamily